MPISVITADIVDSTTLTKPERLWLNARLNVLLTTINSNYFARYEQYRGDSFQCQTKDVKGLSAALVIKSYVKSLRFTEAENPPKKLDVRVSLAIGEMEIETEHLATSDGEAFRLSGKRLDGMKKEKRTFCITTKDLFERELETEGLLLDTLLSKATALQCGIVYEKLLGRTEESIAKALNIKQSTVNQHSTGAGWNAIYKTIQRFEEIYGS